MKNIRLIHGDSCAMLSRLRPESIDCCVTSPPYFGLRDYGVAGQIGLEQTPEAYVARLVDVFRQVRRVLRPKGTLWLNLGDSYASGEIGRHDALGAVSGNAGIIYKGLGEAQRGVRRQQQSRTGLAPKNLLGIPWRVAFALQADGWYLRSDIIWSKPNPMPESVKDRPTKAHEYMFLLAKSERYYYDAAAIAERATNGEYFHGGYDKPGVLRPTAKRNGRKSAHIIGTPRNDGDRSRLADGGVAPRGTRNKRTVWTVTPRPFKGAHFATFPPDLVKPCILAGCPRGGTVLDPFNGAATTGVVARQLGRKYVGIELNAEYLELSRQRLAPSRLARAA